MHFSLQMSLRQELCCLLKKYSLAKESVGRMVPFLSMFLLKVPGWFSEVSGLPTSVSLIYFPGELDLIDPYQIQIVSSSPGGKREGSRINSSLSATTVFKTLVEVNGVPMPNFTKVSPFSQDLVGKIDSFWVVFLQNILFHTWTLLEGILHRLVLFVF